MRLYLLRNRVWLVGLFLLGVAHWLCFFYLLYPGTSERAVLQKLASPQELFAARTFSMHDWYKEMRYYSVLQQGVRSRTLPFHSPGLDTWAVSPPGSDRFLGAPLDPLSPQGEPLDPLTESPRGRDRFLGTPLVPLSPQVLLLCVMQPRTFAVINLLLMYTVGFFGCLLLRRYYHLGAIAFALLFLLFNFNGYFVEKVVGWGFASISGYFLMPIVLLALLRMSGLEAAASSAYQVRWGLVLGGALAAILYPGSMHLFVECLTFIVLWALWNWRRWRGSLTALVTAFAVGAARLLPVAVTFGPAPNPHISNPMYGRGYQDFSSLVEAFVSLRTQLSYPRFYVWEESLFVSVVGFLLLVYFGIYAPLMGSNRVRFHGWRSLAIPNVVLLLASMRDWKRYIIPDALPLLNAESLSTRYMVIPLLFLVVIAAINLQRCIEEYWAWPRVKALVLGHLVVLSVFLMNHSRLWRLHRAQDEFDLFQLPPPRALQVGIQNNVADTVYIGSVWIGVGISCVAIGLVGVLAVWLSRCEQKGQLTTQSSVEAVS